MHVNVKVSGLAAGLHGAHIHAIGSCTPDAAGVAFGGAGAHFNPHLARTASTAAASTPNTTPAISPTWSSTTTAAAG